ncbi:17328_t:CDS:2, partial [Entrophospora sp. SA101]
GPLLTQLLSFQQTLQHSNNLEFYTDGSLVGLGTIQMSMSFIILQTALNAPQISFSATVEKWPSSTYNLLIRFIEDGPLLTQLLSFQQTLQHSNNLEFYTDGSLVGLGTIQMSMSFIILQTALNAPQISFSATVEKWPSSTCAEVAAIIIALLISPKNSQITIFTDSKASIKHFNTLQNSKYPLMPRNIFKEASNSLLWTILNDIVNINNINSRGTLQIKCHSI